MRRRQFLTGSAALAGASALGAAGNAAQREPGAARPAVYLVPGYRSDLAQYRGRPAFESPELRRSFPGGYDGPATLVTRIDEADGSIRRALMPIRGHAISVAPGGGLAVWNSMEGATLVSFDPVSLELGWVRGFEEESLAGGGHAVFLGGDHVAVTERRLAAAYSGRPADHYGRIAIREAESLRLIERYSAHGMAPHDMALLDGGKHLAVAHYGSHLPTGDWRPQIHEPCIAVIETASGKLVDKLHPQAPFELRHLAGGSGDRLAGVLVRRGSREEEAALLDSEPAIYEGDGSIWDAGAFLPAPVVGFAAGRRWQALPADPLLARQAQSILYDALWDEFIVSFTSSHAIGVFGGAGEVRRVIRTDRFGLRYPRGLALHPDGLHYAVSGSWRDLLLFQRGAHEPDMGRAVFAVLFEHSHLSIA